MGEMVTYRTDGGTSKGYLAIPSDSAPSPAVIVVQERWGLTPHITSVADCFAEAGFVALTPDLRRDDVTEQPDDVDKLLTGLAVDRAAQALASAADYLTERPEVTGDKIGCVGFCAGGSLALWSATAAKRIGATIGFYPILPWPRMRSEWTDYAGKSALIHCCDQDGSSAAEGVQAVWQAIQAAGGDCVTYDYPDTLHSFFDDDRPEVFHQQAAASSWAHTLEFLRTTLG